MAESVSIREEMTSVEAGLTLTWFDERRRLSFCGLVGRERLFFSFGLDTDVFTEIRSGMEGPIGGKSTVAIASNRPRNEWTRSAHGHAARAAARGRLKEVLGACRLA